MGKPTSGGKRPPVALRVTEWVMRWNEPLTRFISRRVPAHVDPEDLAQEVYLRLLRVEHLELIEEPHAYLYQMARNIAAEWHRQNHRRAGNGSAELDELIDLITPETQTEEALEEKQLERALRGLPPMVRAAMYLKLRNGATHEEIAQQLGVSRRMVRKHLTTGYAAIRRWLIKEGAE